MSLTSALSLGEDERQGQQGYSGIFVRVLMGYEGQKPRAVSAGTMLRAAEERKKKKIPTIANKYF